jgi:hypothetical protein
MKPEEYQVDELLLCPEEWETATEYYDPAGVGPDNVNVGEDGAPLCAGCGCGRHEHKDVARERVFEALDNARENGYDFRFTEPEAVATDLGTYDADLQGEGERLIPHIREWQASKR